MIDWNKANKLITERDNKRVELIQAPSIEEKNAIKAEIKNLDKQIEKILGKKEYSRVKEVRGKDSKEEEQKIKKYYEFKETESKINSFSVAVKRFLRKLMKKNEKQQKLVAIKNENKEYVKKAA